VDLAWIVRSEKEGLRVWRSHCLLGAPERIMSPKGSPSACFEPTAIPLRVYIKDLTPPARAISVTR